METPTSKRHKFIEDLDRNLAILGLIFAALLVLLMAVTGFGYIDVGAMVLLASVTYLAIRNHLLPRGISSLQDLSQNRSIYLILNLLFMLLFFYSMTSVVLRPELYIRPVGYFISTALMVVVVAVEILFFSQRKAHIAFILIKIVLIALSVRWTPQFIFPGLIGVDPWAHQAFTTKILEAGAIPTGFSYSELPLMHLMISATSLATGLSYKFATMLSVSFLQAIGFVFVFLLGRFIFDSKVGLLAALLLAVGVKSIPLGTGVIPTSMALVIVAIVTYMVFKAREERPLTYTSLILILSAVLILTHTLTALCMAILLFSFWAGFELYKRIYGGRFNPPATLALAILFTVAMFGWWTYASGHISTLRGMISWGFRVGGWEAAEYTVEYMSTVPYYELLLSQLGYLLFLAISIVGAFYMLAKKFGSKYSFSLCVGGLLLVAIAFGSVALGLTGLLPDRWQYFSYIIMAVPAAVGVLSICACFGSHIWRISALAILVFIISFLSITAPEANYDNPIYSKHTTARYAFTESELSGMNTVSDIWDGRVGVATSSEFYYFAFNRDKQVTSTASNLDSKDFSDLTGQMVVISDDVVNNYFAFEGGGMKLDYDPRELLAEQSFNRLYDCGSIYAYLKP